MPTDPKPNSDYPHVAAWQFGIIAKYGDLLVETGGNDPRDLLNDFQKPSPNNLMAVNIVRFTLAMGVRTQVAVIQKLQDAGLL